MGLAPIGDDTAPPPMPTPNDPYPEVLSLLDGRSVGYVWVQARGYIHASIGTAWQAFQNPDVVTDRRRVTSWHSDPVPMSPYAVSFVVHNEVDSLVTVTFDITFNEDVGEGTANAPTVVSLHFDKTAGTSFLQLVAGSVVLRAVDSNVTSVEFLERENAVGQDQNSLAQFIQDFFASAVAAAHGQPLPTY
jgi:hypothetical protein